MAGRSLEQSEGSEHQKQTLTVIGQPVLVLGARVGYSENLYENVTIPEKEGEYVPPFWSHKKQRPGGYNGSS